MSSVAADRTATAQDPPTEAAGPGEVVDGRPSPVKRAVTMISPWLFLGVVLLALLLPRLMGEGFFSWGITLSFTLAYVLYASSWDIVSGFTGQVNFGHSAFIGTGGFITAIVSERAGADLWLVILLSTVVAAVLGVIIGVPALRLSGPYLALVTLTVVTALSQVELVLKEYTGGEEGVVGVARLMDDPVLGPVGGGLATVLVGEAYTDGRTLDQDLFVDYLLLVVVAALVVGGLLLLGYSKRGLVLRSVQQDPVAAEAAGVPVRSYKVVAFVLSGALGGLAGGLIVAVRGNANPDLLFVTLSLLIIVMAALGGVGTIIGPVLGAVIVGFLDYKLLDTIDFVRANPDTKIGIFALILIVVVLVQPRGLLPPLQGQWRKVIASRNRTEIAIGLASVMGSPALSHASAEDAAQGVAADGSGGAPGDAGGEAARTGADPAGAEQERGVDRG